jgi:NAD-dependent SIR2 family protein deacetylase
MLTRSFCDLADLLDGRRVVVLTGAGCSTESGIPDYRGPDSAKRTRKPILYQEFTRDRLARRRYWARSAVGWRRVAGARPNPGHRALARMEEGGLVRGVVTQNVDGLHQAAGSSRVVELHGNLAEVVCLECGATEPRDALQQRLLDLNPDWSHSAELPAPFDDAESAPDGDVELSTGLESAFQVAPCLRCGGVLKPDVVFFGENVPKERVDAAWELFDEADVLLVAGSSLTVYSGYRFILGAAERNLPVGIVNLGRTRGDEIARVRVHGRTGEVLPALSDTLL